MEWRDEGVLLSLRKHGEGSAIIEVFTEAHGRHLGVVRGGASRKMAPHLQPGAQLSVEWRARLEDHLGAFQCDPAKSRASLLDDPLALAGLGAVCALLHVALPEREPFSELYGSTQSLLDSMTAQADWLAQYLRWEMQLLEQIGFGLDLTRCAVTGARDGLVFVSPKTGRAVTREGAGEWADRMLPLPPVLLGQGPVSKAEAAEAMQLTGHFLTRELADRLKQGPLPEARARLQARLSRL